VKTVCAWCNKETGEKDGKGIKGISHGMCEECFARLMRDVENKIHTNGGDKNAARF